MNRNEQLAVIRAAIALVNPEHAQGRDMINRALRVWADGHSRLEDLP